MTLEFDENNNNSGGIGNGNECGGDGCCYGDVIHDHKTEDKENNAAVTIVNGICRNGAIGNGLEKDNKPAAAKMAQLIADDSSSDGGTVIASEGIIPDGIDPHAHFLDRLMQTASMLFYLFTFLIAPGMIVFAFAVMALCPPFWPFLLAYLVWFIYDFSAPCRGSRSNNLVHYWSLWRNVANYFPIEVHKTADIPPDHNYVFACHPHGVFATGIFIAFGCGGRNFRSLFSGIKMHLVTLPMNFWFPFRRELYLLFGNLISCQVESLEYVLSSAQKGNAIGIVPGGAAEALHAFPGVNRLVLAKRKGFIRLAIKHGAHLVPVYNFGENDVLEQLHTPKGSRMQRVQSVFKQLTGVSLPLCYGQNSLTAVLPKTWVEKMPRFLTVGFLPFRRRIVTVVGKPMPVQCVPNPSRELVDAVHAEYCARLQELFNTYKSSLGGLPDNAKLEFV